MKICETLNSFCLFLFYSSSDRASLGPGPVSVHTLHTAGYGIGFNADIHAVINKTQRFTYLTYKIQSTVLYLIINVLINGYHYFESTHSYVLEYFLLVVDRNHNDFLPAAEIIT